MAVTLAKLTSDVRNIATSGTNPDDFRISNNQIEFWVNEIRSMLISQAIQKRQDISDVWVQSLTCVNLIQVDKSECECNTTDCIILRSENKLPRTVESDSDNLIIAVTGNEGKTISKYNKHNQKYSKYRKYTAAQTGWFLKNDYLYIINDKVLQKVNIFGIFEDPKELTKYTGCDDKPCFTVDSDYPCSLKMANDIVNIVVKTKVQALMSFPQDLLNDSSNLTPAIKQSK